MVALLLLVSHTFQMIKLSVDSTSILLLALMLVSPFMAAIKKIKFGDFEAEIDAKEVRRIKEQTEAALEPKVLQTERIPEIHITVQDIRELAKSDVVLALAKLRIELEKVLKRIASAVKDSMHEEEPKSLGLTVQRLMNQEIIAPDMARSLREVIAICNRAVHGESITESDASVIINVGTDLLEGLYWQVKDIISGRIISEEVIDSSEVERYYKKNYQLTTIIPLVVDPKRVVREVSQDQLEDYLDGYYEFAEFIVDLRESSKNIG